ncbi:RNA recognition motif domain-containing protein [Dinghuibacter silviterrae]|jgi:RNA recognition motif-containing protein|uniref:RNA recognition motif-containing protein n=1 Tax=Dinghuibacter silviterrae TaxID=1539049 RepID=A0A4R8DDW8_9BACT|nr:RNA-binding protein [Dinghuibacter silviterrae]TDW95671.1 RNA recognition motif-containing protein [Dinghuibacter silviterrae]
MNLYVANLSWGISEEDLKNVFQPYGAVTSVKIVTDRETGRSRGFGFVEMEDENAGQQAIAGLNDTELQGRKIVVKESFPRPQNNSSFKRGNSGGGGYGGGGGYRRGGNSGGGYGGGGGRYDR